MGAPIRTGHSRGRRLLSARRLATGWRADCRARGPLIMPGGYAGLPETRGGGPVRSLSGFARARRAVPVGMAIAGTLLPTTHFGASATAVAHPAFQRVAYRGHSFEVPRGWRVIHLSDHRRTCVRFDRHVVYVGTPPVNQEC